MRLVVGLLGLLAAAPAAGAKPRVCVVNVSDTSNQLPDAQTVSSLEAALRRHFTVVPNKRVARAARVARLGRSQWLEPAGLTALSKSLGFEFAVGARAASTFGTWTFYLTVWDARSGEVRAESHAVLVRPKLTDPGARDLVAALVEQLKKRDQQEQGPAVPAPAPVLMPAPDPAPPVAAPVEPAASEPAVADSTATGGDVWDQAADGFGGAAVDTSVAETLRTEVGVEVGGRIAFEHYGFFTNGEAGKVSGRDNVDAALRVKVAHPRVTVFASLLGRYDFADPARNRFEPDDAWVELNFPGLTIKAGRFVAGWGSGSLYSPSDVLNPVDLRDPLDPEKWGTLMLKASVTFGPATLEAYYLPVPEINRLPTITGISRDGRLESASRWIRGTVDVEVTAPVTFVVSPMQPASPRPSNSQAAGRLRLSVGGADVSLGYAYLMDRFPSSVSEAVPAAGVPLETTVYLDWLYRRLHVITLDVERTFGRLRLAGEVAAFLTRDLQATNRNVADPYLLVDVGADLQTSAFLGEQRLHFFLEFATAQALVGSLATEGIDLWRYPFTLSLLGRISWEITADLKVDLNAVSSLRRFDLFLSPRLEYSFFDRVKVQVGVDLLLGDASAGFFGPYRDNSRFIAVVESRF